MTNPEFLTNVVINNLSAKDQFVKASSATVNNPADNVSCKKNMHVGIFFDGTDNNLDRDSRGGKLCYTNIVKLYRAYSDVTKNGYYRHYVPGVGTIFPEGGEDTEDLAGKSRGYGGGKRIYYAMFRLLNDVGFMYRPLPVIPDHEITTNLKTGFFKDGGLYESIVTDLPPAAFFKGFLSRLNVVIKESKKPIIISEINISVYGFSRGAAQARAFCNLFHRIVGESGELCGIKTKFDFLGIFDTVASVRMPESTPYGLGGNVVSGLQSWADGTMQIHKNVKRCVHFVAGHEFRLSFPVSSIMYNGVYPQNSREIVYPGVHCDVGGGYAPGDQGKSSDTTQEQYENDKKIIEMKYSEKIRVLNDEHQSYYTYKKYMYDDNWKKAVELRDEKHRADVRQAEDDKAAEIEKLFNEYNDRRNQKGIQSLISQIPLRHMHEEAYRHVLPMMGIDELNYEAKIDYSVDTNMQSLVAKYVDVFKEKNSYRTAARSKMDALEGLFITSQEIHLRWRWYIQLGINLAGLKFYESANSTEQKDWFNQASIGIRKLNSCKKANAQEIQDMIEANKDYLLDMWEICISRDEEFRKQGQRQIPLSLIEITHRSTSLKCRKSLILGMTKLIDTIAHNEKNWIDSVRKNDPKINQLFDEFVHDSHAGFYIAGPRSDYEKHENIRSAKGKFPLRRSNFEKELAEATVDAFPLMTDEKSPDLRTEMLGITQWLISKYPCRASTRREAGGHVKMRCIFDSNKG